MKPVVSIARVIDQDTFAALTEAVSRLGNLADLIPPGSSIVVKPNYVMGPTERGITNPAVVEAVVRLAASTSPSRLVIGEGSADCYTPSVFRLHNVYDLASRYGAECVDLNQDECVAVAVPEELGRDRVMLPRTMAECDILISVPTFKLWMGRLPMTLSLKNLFGCFPARHYGHNAHSNELVQTEPYRTLEGEVGTEPGVHIPSPEHNITAINLARTSNIQIVDAIEGSDGKGNYVRMDTLMVGTNPVATDAVALAVAGFTPEEQTQMQMCSQYGLGPCRLQEIDVVGETIDSVRFRLQRIPANVRELPIAYCLDRLHVSEFDYIERGLRFYGFLAEEERLGRREMRSDRLQQIICREGYLTQVLETLPENAVTVLQRIVALGGSSSSYFDVLNNYVDDFRESNSFWSGLRALMRLGLAFVFDGQHKPYIILAEGVTAAATTKGLLPETTAESVAAG
ncbi:MAG: DUF362 domain-containing protein [Gemmatimonadetes bacterium]|jgi:uncharacterized protein (DUF362 family)|nr:DUF362 domain-containing protein [Gemmatimonadota bacterium]MBT6149804.1 DUF362 domain-containing protein [Gemmatimonadota bacterium]MBT7862426.1 DUF362 domain-containing protein [Gemmatimonadota bacterium]